VRFGFKSTDHRVDELLTLFLGPARLRLRMFVKYINKWANEQIKNILLVILEKIYINQRECFTHQMESMIRLNIG